MDNDKIEFALIIAEYVAELNIKRQSCLDVDNANWRHKILQEAQNTELYRINGYVDSEWAYEHAYEIAERLIEKYEF